MRVSTVFFRSMLLSVLLVPMLVACGGESNCEDVECERGICSSDSGQCVNLDECNENTDCIEGYACGSNGTCEPLVECQEGECERGQCADGVCVSSDSCDSDDECAAYDYCSDEGSCVDNPCFDKECSGGVCQASTGECVSKEVCTAENEDEDCVDGEICYNRNCFAPDEFCAQIDCQRGVCSPEQRRCINAQNCSDNSECLTNYFCAEDGTCKENKCRDQVRGCRRGVCAPNSGTCVNPDQCDSSSDCLTGHVCVEDECRPEDTACGKEGCPGNQVCEYNSSALTATCRENEETRCRNALDCVDDRICEGADCAEPSACEADSMEPNDSESEATIFEQVAGDASSAVEANLCESDTDLYVFDTREQPELRGTLVTELEIADRDVGIGGLDVSVVGPDGSTRKTAQLDRDSQRLRLEVEVTAASRGQYQIKVAPRQRVSAASIDYSLFADLVGQNLTRVCSNAQSLEDGRRISDNTDTGRSTQLGTICGGGQNRATEKIYRIEIEETSFVTFNIAPEDFDVVAGLRRSCERLGSEIACADSSGSGGDENINQILEPGTYYLVVQGTSQDESGPFEIFTGIQPSVCQASDNRCKDDSTARVCNDRGTGFETIECEQGCDRSRGICRRKESDLCYNAVELVDNATNEIDFNALNDDFNPSLSTCSESENSPPTSGADAVYEVEVGAKQSLNVRMATSPDSESTATMYLAKQCNYPGNTCIKATSSQESPHTFNYLNRSNLPERLYLYVDLSNETEIDSGLLEVNLEDIACRPGSRRCNGQTVEECNQVGSGYTDIEECNYSCINATCQPPPNNECSGAFTVQPGGTTTGDISDYSGYYDPSSSQCGGALSWSPRGPDAVYMFETTTPDEIVDIELRPNFDGALWVTTDCSTPLESCTMGSDQAYEGGNERVRFVAEEPKTYYVIVDSFGSTGTDNSFELELDTAQRECNNLNKPIRCKEPSNGVLEYCTNWGQKADYTCNSTCSTGGAATLPRCDDPTGETCLEPKILSDGDTVSGDFSGSDDLTLPGNAQSGACFLGEFEGTNAADSVYSIDLSAGDLLEADLNSSTSDALMYITEDCGLPSGCREVVQGSGSGYYYAEKDARIQIVVDGTSSISEERYELSVDIRQGVCAPGNARCTEDSNLEVCNGDGSAVQATYECPNQCRNGACSVGSSSINQCGAADAIGSGGVFYGSFSELDNDVQIGNSGCTNEAGDGPDATYEVSLSSGDILTAEVESYNAESPMLYILEDCNNPDQNCRKGAASSNRSTAELFYEATQSETVKLVVDAAESDASGDYRLDVEKRQTECSPGNVECGSNGQTSKVCNSFGLFNEVRCKQNCRGGRCVNPTGETCLDAISVAKNAELTGQWSGQNDINPGRGEIGTCFFTEGSQPQGPETIYRVELNAGDLLEASLQTEHSDAMLYFKDSCGVRNNCRSGEPTTGTQTRHYYARQNKTAYIVVDTAGVATPSESFELELSVEPDRVCNPGEPSCSDISTVEICNEDGTSFGSQYQCTGQCIDGACRPNIQSDEQCSSATNVGEGIYLYGDFDRYSNDIEVTPSSNCVANTGDGPDLVYNVTVSPDEIVRAEAQSFAGEELMVSIHEDCSNPDDTCLSGGVGQGVSTASAYFRPETTKTVSVVVDSVFDSASGPFSLSIEKIAPQCDTGQRTCGNSGKTLKYCNQSGLFETYRCDGSCSNGDCANPTGDVCVDAIPIDKNGTYSGTYSDFEDNLDPGAGVNSCIQYGSGSPDGEDAVFSVELEKGDLLSASLETDVFDPVLYILDRCTGSDLCKAGKYDPQQLQYYAPESGTYYVVVDKGGISSNGDFTLNLGVDENKACQPGGANCSSGSSTRLDICSSDGENVRYSVECSESCLRGACKRPGPANDDCSSAYEVSGSTRIVDSFGRFSDKRNLTSNCPVVTSPGADAVYAVDLEPGEFLEASVTTPDNFSDVSLYISDDCGSSSNGCLTGSEPGGDSASAGYLSENGGKVFVVVENGEFAAAQVFTVDLRVEQSECTPGQQRCAGPDTKQTCSSYGVWNESTCYFGCSRGSCQPPTNNKCGNATVVPRDGQEHTYQGPIGEYSNDYELNSPSCTGSSTPGPEALYQVNAREGDVISASWSSPGDASLWVGQDCSNLTDTCLVGANQSSDPQTLQFKADASKTYYIVADTATSASGTYTLDVSVTPEQCEPGTASCASATSLNYCHALGDGFSQYECDGGCNTTSSGARCGSPTGDLCVDAVQVDGSMTTDVDMSERTNQFEARGTCYSGGTPTGRDVVYEISLAADENLSVDVTPSGSDNPALYLLQDCLSAGDSIDRSCPAQADSAGGGSAESLSYISRKQQTVYLVVDGGSQSQTTENWNIDISIDPRICDPLSTSCNSSSELRYCKSLGAGYDTYTCSDSCSNGDCANPSGDVGFEPIPITSSGVVTGTYSDFENDYNPGGSGCTGFSAEGPDAVYEVELQQGQMLSATLNSTASSGAEDTSLWVVSNFLNAPSTCLDGSDSYPSGESISYTASSDETVYIIADAYAENASGTYELDVTIQ